MKKIFIASDHAGFKLKQKIIDKFSKKLKFKDLGTDSAASSVNYPDYAHKLCKNVAKNKSHLGILICGSAMGMTMAANRHKKIRAALCYSVKNTNIFKNKHMSIK